MKALTQRQADIYRFIKAHIKEKGMSPTAVEIGEEFEIYPNGAWLHVVALIKKGAVTHTKSKARSIMPVKGFRMRVKR